MTTWGSFNQTNAVDKACAVHGNRGVQGHTFRQDFTISASVAPLVLISSSTNTTLQ